MTQDLLWGGNQSVATASLLWLNAASGAIVGHFLYPVEDYGSSGVGITRDGTRVFATSFYRGLMYVFEQSEAAMASA